MTRPDLQSKTGLTLPNLMPFAFTALAVLLSSTVYGGDATALPAVVRFNEHIRPIFNKHCIACHGGVRQAAHLSYVYRDLVLPPGGHVIEPGDPEASLLIERVTSSDPAERMPPPEHGPALSQREVELLREWIRQGANWEDPWAFVKPKRQPLPVVRDPGWCRCAVDCFVLALLEQEGLRPAAEAAPARWLRRASLDLTGLPPSPAELSGFLRELEKTGEAAYAAAVDSLLARTSFGERWASVWLDQVRYADSKGLGQDGRRNIWKYRDWVIESFNRDLPYDQFTIKQIAGDLLPDPDIDDLTATACHRLTQSNEEGGTDDEEFRVAAVLDRVNTTWQTWQALTFGCVQCHNHPYDPIRNQEYYKYAAFFNNTADCDLDEDWPVIQAPVDPSDYARAHQLDAKIEALRNTIWRREYALLANTENWRPLKGLQASSDQPTRIVVEPRGDHDEFHTVDTVTQNTDITLQVAVPESLSSLTAIRLTAMPLDPAKAVSDSEWGFVLSHVEAELIIPGESTPQQLRLAHVIGDEPDPFFDPDGSLNARSRGGFAAYSRIHFPRQAALVLEAPIAVPPGSTLRVQLEHRVFLLAAFPLVTRRGHLAVTDSSAFSTLLADSELEQCRTELEALSLERRRIRSTSVPVLRERPDRLARPSYVFERGLFLTKAERVEADVPASLLPLPDGLARNRLALAHWMVSPDNPLTARVAVNRFWARLFGVGLVATEEDFGSSGEAPSHPELLDYLAVRFQNEHGWSVKSLLRELVLSSTYRQSGAIAPGLYERDPRNRLLARGPRHRLPAEMVRDSALAIAGLLCREQFGPPVHPPIPDGVWKPFQAGDRWRTPGPGEADRYRRSVYTYTKRSIPYPMFAAFDAPSREFCVPRRLQSNTPLQALMTLNDQTFDECAHALAGRMAAASRNPREQLRFGFLLATCRQPCETELNDLIELYQPGFVPHNQTEPSAALTAVARVLLNLDEVLTK